MNKPEESKIKWEVIEQSHAGVLYRSRVFGGWLVKHTDTVITISDSGKVPTGEGFEWRSSICFIPDMNGEWLR